MTISRPLWASQRGATGLWRGGLWRSQMQGGVGGGGGDGEDYSNAQIGDEIGGGIYAGIDTIGGVDYHIVAALASGEAYGLQWKTSRTATAGTTSEEDGLANTEAMEAAGLVDHPAAAHCLAYDGGGHSDWHMPARNQNTLLHNNLAGHHEFAENVSTNDFTWSSTESGSNGATARRIGSGTEQNLFKDDTMERRTRPIRRIPV